MKERMLKGLAYLADDEELTKLRNKAGELCFKFNKTSPVCKSERQKILTELLNQDTKDINITGPIWFDYGINTIFKGSFYANYNLVILDVAKVTIGNNVMCGPNVTISTAGHPIHHKLRNTGYEYGKEISIGDNVWIGANVTVNPGVKIGNNVVIGSNSVITKDIEDDVVVAGCPFKIIKKITDEDLYKLYKDELIDIEIDF